jgi:hypothetical protein
MPDAAPREAEYLLLIADISGYTRFMLTNQTARVHAHGIISDLISVVAQEVRLPLEVNKLEGDALFMVAQRQTEGWGSTGSEIGGRLDAFTTAFDRKLTDLARSNVCTCIACQQMVSLRIKVIGHYGVAVRSDVAGFDELSGVDVIKLHRLLKNSVPDPEYILLTDPAFTFLAPPGDYRAHDESYDDVGTIPLHLRTLMTSVPASAARTFSAKDMIRKRAYGIRYRLARARHPAS